MKRSSNKEGGNFFTKLRSKKLKLICKKVTSAPACKPKENGTSRSSVL